MLDLGIVAEAFVRDADARLNESLRRGGIAVHETPPSMQFMLQRHHLVIHHGGIGTAQTALALGRPQLLVPRHFEQTLTAHRLVQLGVGAAIPQRARMAEIRAAIDGIMRSPELPRRSRATAEEIAGRIYRPLLDLLSDEAARAVSTRAHAHL
jgi:UDP:flavonoid glycosyltransferase YjiC (YdhE family)